MRTFADLHRFEKELERLRKEMELASASGTSLATATPSQPSTPYIDHPISPSTQGDHTEGEGDSSHNLDASPLILPGIREHAADMEVPEMMLDKAARDEDEHHAGSKEKDA